MQVLLSTLFKYQISHRGLKCNFYWQIVPKSRHSSELANFVSNLIPYRLVCPVNYFFLFSILKKKLFELTKTILLLFTFIQIYFELFWMTLKLQRKSKPQKNKAYYLIYVIVRLQYLKQKYKVRVSIDRFKSGSQNLNL